MAALRIQLFGGFQVLVDGAPAVGTNTPRSQRVLIYLLLHRHAPQPRQRIAETLWPSSGTPQAQANLRKELSHLRRILPQGDRLIWADNRSLQWQSGSAVSLDVDAFEQTLTAAESSSTLDSRWMQLKQALSYYRGDLLPDQEDEWVVVERERLHRLRLNALENLIAGLEAQADYSTALTFAQQLLQLDTLNETTYQTVMRLHHQLGDRASALQVYHQCMTQLQEELGVLPSPATRQLYDQLLQEQPIPGTDHTPPKPVLETYSLPQTGAGTPALPLVGRGVEWDAILQWVKPLEQFQSGQPCGMDTVLLVTGEPGIGKTRLLEELRIAAQRHHLKVLWGQGFAAELRRPYGMWADGLRAAGVASTADRTLPPELGVLLPELGPAPAFSEMGALLDAVAQLFGHWARQAPLLVLLDDVQWIDEASATLLHYVIRVQRPLPVGFACTARAAELASNRAMTQVLQGLRREQRLQTLDISPLTPAHTAELIRRSQVESRVDLPPDFTEQILVESGGNPLFALEIARSVMQPTAARPHTLEALICDRIQHLEETARDFLPWAAALGRRFDPMTVATIADFPMLRLLAVIEHLEQQAIIRPSPTTNAGSSYDFAHDILRQTVYQQISAPRRQLMHRQIAHQLQAQAAETPDLAGDVAYHAALGGDYALAASASLAMAERCLRLFAYQEALELAQQGIQQSQRLTNSQRLPLQAKLLRVTVIAGLTQNHTAQLEADIQALIREASSLGLTEAAASATETLMALQFEQSNFTGVYEQSLRMAEAHRLASPVTAARRLAYSGSCLAEIGRDMAKAEALLLEAQSLAERVGLDCCDLHSGLGCVHRHNGRYDTARTHLQRAWQLAQAEQDHWRESWILSYLAMTELEAENPAAALPYCREMATVATQLAGEGSEGAVAAALEALACYQLRGQAEQTNGRKMEGRGVGDEETPVDQALSTAIEALQRVDAKRMLAYVLMGAAEVDLSSDRALLAARRAQQALICAEAFMQPNDIALSRTLWIAALLAQGLKEDADLQWENLQSTTNPYDLSRRANIAVERVETYFLANQPQPEAATD